MAEIKLNKRYKYAGDIFRKLIDIGFDIETATVFLNEVDNADVVPVVRCKDCKHLMFSDCYGECSRGYKGIVSPDDYCSYGKRSNIK